MGFNKEKPVVVSIGDAEAVEAVKKRARRERRSLRNTVTVCVLEACGVLDRKD